MGIFLIRLPGELNVTMLDVGQGECVGIETREHHVYLVDAGSTSKKKDRTVPDYSMAEIYRDAERGRNFHHALGRRPHQRGRGAVGVVEKQPGQNPRIFLPDVALKDEVLETLLQQIEEAEVSVEYLSAGEHMTDGALQISCLHPYAKKCRRIATMRRWCCACHRGDFQMLLTGDLERAAKTGWWNRRDPLRKIPSAAPSSMPGTWRVQCDGRSTVGFGTAGAGPDFLRQNNRYGHPAWKR